MGNPVASAFIAAILAGVIIAPVFGLQIIRAGATTQLQPDWGMILMGMGLVFGCKLTAEKDCGNFLKKVDFSTDFR